MKSKKRARKESTRAREIRLGESKSMLENFWTILELEI
jgi:hypothetical protein